LAAASTESWTVAGEPAAPESFTGWPFWTGPTTSSQLQDRSASSSLMAWLAVTVGVVARTGPAMVAPDAADWATFAAGLCCNIR